MVVEPAGAIACDVLVLRSDATHPPFFVIQMEGLPPIKLPLGVFIPARHIGIAPSMNMREKGPAMKHGASLIWLLGLIDIDWPARTIIHDYLLLNSATVPLLWVAVPKVFAGNR